MQEFGLTLIFIKGGSNVVSDSFIQLPMAHHAHKLSDKSLKEDICELLCLYLLFISDNIDCFLLDIEEI